MVIVVVYMDDTIIVQGYADFDLHLIDVMEILKDNKMF